MGDNRVASGNQLGFTSSIQHARCKTVRLQSTSRFGKKGALWPKSTFSFEFAFSFSFSSSALPAGGRCIVIDRLTRGLHKVEKILCMISCMIHIRASSSRNGGRGHWASGTLHIAQCILHCIDAILPRKELEEREGGGWGPKEDYYEEFSVYKCFTVEYFRVKMFRTLGRSAVWNLASGAARRLMPRYHPLVP